MHRARNLPCPKKGCHRGQCWDMVASWTSYKDLCVKPNKARLSLQRGFQTLETKNADLSSLLNKMQFFRPIRELTQNNFRTIFPTSLQVLKQEQDQDWASRPMLNKRLLINKNTTMGHYLCGAQSRKIKPSLVLKCSKYKFSNLKLACYMKTQQSSKL